MNISVECDPTNATQDYVFSRPASMTAGVGAALCSAVGAFLNMSTIIALLNYSKYVVKRWKLPLLNIFKKTERLSV